MGLDCPTDGALSAAESLKNPAADSLREKMQPGNIAIVLVAVHERAAVLEQGQGDARRVHTRGQDPYALKPYSAVSTGAVSDRADKGRPRRQCREEG